MTEASATPEAFLSAIDLGSPLEAVVLLKRTGVSLAAWTRNRVPLDVLTVMAATLLGSLDTIVEALGGPSPKLSTVEAAGRKMLATKVDSNIALFLVAPSHVSDAYLREEASRIIRRLPVKASGAPSKAVAAP